MRQNNSENRKFQIMCDTIFSLFAFVYLYFFQKDLLGMMYAKLPAADILSYSPFFVSLLLTLIIILIGIQIRKILRFQNMWYACNYLPSAFLLGLCTSCTREHFFYLSEKSWYIVLLFFILIVGVFKILSMVPQGRNNLMKWPYAVLLLFVTCCATLFVGNTDENLHRELKVATLIEKGCYEKALEVGAKADETTLELTLLRSEALLQLPAAEKGSAIADRIFTYPISNPALVADSLYAYNDSIIHKNDNAGLVAMLIEKDLDKFIANINVDSDNHLRLSSWYPGILPRYYMEAMVLYEYVSETDCVDLKNLYPTQYNKVKEEFANYIETKKELYKYSEQNRRNRLYMSHGKTYWWYFDFQD